MLNGYFVRRRGWAPLSDREGDAERSGMEGSGEVGGRFEREKGRRDEK
jgi:hypothetical protein